MKKFFDKVLISYVIRTGIIESKRKRIQGDSTIRKKN